MNKSKFIILFYLSIVTLFFVNSCSSNDNKNENSKVSGLNGMITFEEFDNIFDKHKGIFSFNLKDGKAERGTRKANGSYPYRHSSGKISLTNGCGDSVTRILIRTLDGITTPVSPCSSELTGKGIGSIHGRRFEYSKISPNGKMLAVELRYLDDNIKWVYSTFIYELTDTTEIAKEIVRHIGFAAPEWLPNGRLLLLAMDNKNRGIYLSDKSLKKILRIDNEQINIFINNADVSPSGEDVVFEYNQQIWIMDMKGKKIKPLIVSSNNLKFPTWSPDGKYVAILLSDSSNDYFKEIQFYEISTGKTTSISTDEIFSKDVYGYYPAPTGPISWIKKL